VTADDTVAEIAARTTTAADILRIRIVLLLTV